MAYDEKLADRIRTRWAIAAQTVEKNVRWPGIHAGRPIMRGGHGKGGLLARVDIADEDELKPARAWRT